MKLASLFLISSFLLTAQVKLPEFASQTLDNGIVLQLMAKKDVPMITLTAIIRGGSESDPSAKAGLAHVTANMLRRGGQAWNADDFSERLDSIGATFSSNVDEQATYVSTQFLSKDLDTASGLLIDAILNPTFPTGEVDKLIKQQIDAAKSAKDRPRGLTARYFRGFFFPEGHPYARQITGDELTLARIQRSDIGGYHRRIYTGRNLILTAVGDFEPAVLGKRLSAAFARLAAGQRYEPASDVPKLERDQKRLLLVDQPSATQTYFLIGQPGIHRTHPDRVPMVLINTLFGGRFTSLLNDALRVDAGLTYGAFSVLQRDRLPGMLAIDTYTATETTEAAIDLALKVLGGLNENGIDAEQLASAKAYVKGRFPTRSLETAGQLAGVLGSLALFDLGRDEIDQYFSRIDAVTLEQANAVIKQRYRVDNLQFVLVGDASKIAETLGKYAENRQVVPVSKPGF